MKMKQLSLFTLLSALLLTFVLSGCSGSQATGAVVSMTELQKVMLAADSSVPEMISVTSDADDAAKLFSYLSDFPYDKVESFLLSYSATGKADEIAVIATKSSEDAADAAKTLRTHLDNRIKLFQQYGKEEVSRAEKGLIFTQDQYAVLIICNNSDAVKTAFTQHLSK